MRLMTAGERCHRANLHMAEAKNAKPADSAAVLVKARRDAKRRLESQPERLDGQARIGAREAANQWAEGQEPDDEKGECVGEFRIELREHEGEEEAIHRR
jgi:hypothetical protein